MDITRNGNLPFAAFSEQKKRNQEKETAGKRKKEDGKVIKENINKIFAKTEEISTSHLLSFTSNFPYKPPNHPLAEPNNIQIYIPGNCPFC
jgi:hypothetical protein